MQSEAGLKQSVLYKQQLHDTCAYDTRVVYGKKKTIARAAKRHKSRG